MRSGAKDPAVDGRPSSMLSIATTVKVAVVSALVSALVTVAAMQQQGEADVTPEQPATTEPRHAGLTPALREAWPGCVAPVSFPQLELPDFALVQPYADATAPVTRMSIDEALTRNENRDKLDDVWWVAKCRVAP